MATNPFKQHINIWKLKCKAEYYMLSAFEEILSNLTDNISCYELFSRTVESEPSDIWSIEAYLENKPDLSIMRDILQKALPEWKFANEIELSKLEDIDWVKRVQENFTPLSIGSFFITNPENAHLCPSSFFKIIIEASRAFGTGEHQTTQGCIEAMQSLRGVEFSRILDLGTGTGILALVAKMLWRDAMVVGSDIEEISVEIAKSHARVNDIDAEFVLFDGVPVFDQKVDLIVSNILAIPLINMAPDFSSIITEGGIVILSGFLDYQSDAVISAYQNNGFELKNILNKNGWITAVMECQI
ncbi:MAG: 50S ribosomal protein L11 methyltransferase [Rickettsiaceae bacterium]|nr:50S ribosomal protein L11 methyltransferase [Rickettsiaceae bacterium]